MIKYIKCLLFIIPILGSCSNAAVQEELTKVKGELVAAKATIAEMEADIEPEGSLVHLVFLKLKPDADRGVLITEIKKLADIEEVLELEVGPFEDLEDARALSDYSILMQLTFANTTAYQNYQQHPIHLALKANTKQYMAGPPVTYDFVKR